MLQRNQVIERMEYEPSEHHASMAGIAAAWLVLGLVALAGFGLPPTYRESRALWHDAHVVLARHHSALSLFSTAWVACQARSVRT